MQGRRKYTQELYDSLVEAFRQSPGKCWSVGRSVGVRHETAKRAWEKGWNKKEWPPIKVYLQEEQEKIRAAREDMQRQARIAADQTREKAREDAIKAQAQEAAGAQLARTNSIALASVVGQLAVASMKLAKKVATTIEDPTYQITPREAMRLYKDMAYVIQHGNDALLTALEIERLRVGEPTSILQIQAGEGTPEETAAQLGSLSRTLERAARLANKGVMIEDLEDDAPDGYTDDEESDEAGLH